MRSGAIKIQFKIINFFFWYGMKLGKVFLKFDDILIMKRKFHLSKSAIPIDNEIINRIVIFEEFPCIKKGS